MTLFDEVETRKSYYETLGVAKTAEAGEIKRAYFGMVRKYQPDRFPGEFKEIRAAYETLADPEKRAEYDRESSLPPFAASMLREARWFAHAGKHGKAGECYQAILKRYPEMDSVREQYAWSLLSDDKNGKAMEVWEELCRRNPDNPEYLRNLGGSYYKRGWIRKAFDAAQRAIALDRSSIESWLLFLGCVIEQGEGGQDLPDRLHAVSLEALEAVRSVKKEEWKKIPLHVHIVTSAGVKNIDAGREHLREIVRLVREGGRNGQDEGRDALKELLDVIPSPILGLLYQDLAELAALLPDTGSAAPGSAAPGSAAPGSAAPGSAAPGSAAPRSAASLQTLNDAKVFYDIQSLEAKGFGVVFHDLLSLLNFGLDEDEDKLEIIAMELEILDNRDRYYPQLRRLKMEFPELYAIHGDFFNEALRARDPEKLLYQREKQFNKLKRKTSPADDAPEYVAEQPVRRAEPKVGRNDPCPCGSGKKYKRCCGA